MTDVSDDMSNAANRGTHHTRPPLVALARLGGVLYAIIIAGGLFGEAFIRGGLIVWGDAAKTAANIRSAEALWRFGIALEFFMLVCTVCLGLILLVLLRPVSRELAWLAIFFNLVTVAVEAANEQRLLEALFAATGSSLSAAAPVPLHAAVGLSLKSYAHGFGVSLVFFACECLIVGYLIFRSRYVPKVVGVLMAFAGACYLINSFALFTSPALSSRIFPAILVPAFIGETSLCLWLLVKGVDVERWDARVRTASIRPMNQRCGCNS